MSFRDFAPQTRPRQKLRPPPGLDREAERGVPSPRSRSFERDGRGGLARDAAGPGFSRSHSDADVAMGTSNMGPQHELLVRRSEEEYAARTLREREAELRDVHRKMHAVNEIYKDLATVVDQQQEQIDVAEEQFGRAAADAQRGLAQLEKANRKHSKRAAGGGGDAPDRGEGLGTDGLGLGRCSLLGYLSRSAAEISRMVSVCTGGAEYGRPD